MFSNPGQKIQGLAVFVFWITILLVVLGIIGIVLSVTSGNIEDAWESIASSIGIGIGGLASTFVLNAIGCVVDDIQRIRESVERMEREGRR